MNIEKRFLKTTELVKQILPLVSQWDINVFKGEALKHPWIDEVMKMTAEQKIKFDASRDYSQLKCPNWLDTIDKVNTLTSFEKVESNNQELKTLGNKKKRHELNRLYKLLEENKGIDIADFGGGVGNLAHFLESELSMKVTIIEKDQKLIDKGKVKLANQKSNIKYQKAHISTQDSKVLKINQTAAIGLHTCGNFATDMFRVCINNTTKKIFNFGCCYSKIQNNDYNLSIISDKDILLNERALSIATLGYKPTTEEIFNYRSQIMSYKFTFYSMLYKLNNREGFVGMSNSRRSLFQLSYDEFYNRSMDKYFPEEQKISNSEALKFYNSRENQNLNNYLLSYYAIARYFSPLIETYILIDRALFLKEHGYEVDIKEVFDLSVSPRGKVIEATLKEI